MLLNRVHFDPPHKCYLKICETLQFLQHLKRYFCFEILCSQLWESYSTKLFGNITTNGYLYIYSRLRKEIAIVWHPIQLLEFLFQVGCLMFKNMQQSINSWKHTYSIFKNYLLHGFVRLLQLLSVPSAAQHISCRRSSAIFIDQFLDSCSYFLRRIQTVIF